MSEPSGLFWPQSHGSVTTTPHSINFRPGLVPANPTTVHCSSPMQVLGVGTCKQARFALNEYCIWPRFSHEAVCCPPCWPDFFCCVIQVCLYRVYLFWCVCVLLAGAK